MDNSLKFWLIIDELIDGSKTISELNKKLNIDTKEIKDILTTLYKFNLDGLWNIEIYDGEDIVTSLEEYKRNYEKLEVMLTNLTEINYSIMLSREERWALYDVLRECNDNFLYKLKEKILKLYDEEFKDKYEAVSNRRLIKQYLGVFNVPKSLIIQLYGYIEKKKTININTLNETIIYDSSPVRIYFDEDMKSWYLEYVKKKKLNYLRIDKIKEIHLSKYRYSLKRGEKHHWGYGKTKTKIKLRIYNEKNAKDIALRFLLRKDIVFEDKTEDYSDYSVFVRDINNFKHWLRSMGSSVIVLEPQNLREQMVNEINKWMKVYVIK